MPRNASCTDCPLHETAKNICVWGRYVGGGVTTPRAFIVGEAPGRQEDERGQPFVGPSGKLLVSALQDAKITNYYATNSVKCFPNRVNPKPKPPEIKACRPYLDEEIATEKPEAILALGDTAWHRLGGVGGITENEGKEVWSEKYNCWLMPARHPAAILRSMNLESSWKLVIQRYAKLLTGKLLDKPPVSVSIATTREHLDKLAVALVEAPAWTYDFETTPIPWDHKDFNVWSMSFSVTPYDAVVVPVNHPYSPFGASGSVIRNVAISAAIHDFFQQIQPIAQASNRPKSAHNTVFDDLVWYRLAGYLPYPTTCTLALVHLLNENESRSLKWQLRAKHGWPDWAVDSKHVDEMALRDAALYNGYDTGAGYLLRNSGLAELTQDAELTRYFGQVEMREIRAVEKIMANGIYVDQVYLDQQIQEQTQKMLDIAASLPIDNPGSAQQVAKWLFDPVPQGGLGLKPLKMTPGGASATDADTLERLALRHPEVRPIRAFRTAQKNLGTWLRPTLKSVTNSYDGREHPDYRRGPTTGRWASPYHTTPRPDGDENIRGMYDAPPGSVLLSGDYRQIEARLVAWAAAGKPSSWDNVGHQTMLWAFHVGRDVYKETAAVNLHKKAEDVTEKERQEMGKVPVLASLYRIGPDGLRDYAWREFQLDWSKAQATAVWAGFRKAWPEIPLWHDREAKAIASRGWAKSAIGRYRRLPDAMTESGYESINIGINFPIQSLASNITGNALAHIHESVPEVKLVGYVHDCIQIECPVSDVALLAGWLTQAMLRAPDRLEALGLKLPPGLIEVEIHAGRWGSKKSVEKWLERYNEKRVASAMAQRFSTLNDSYIYSTDPAVHVGPNNDWTRTMYPDGSFTIESRTRNTTIFPIYGKPGLEEVIVPPFAKVTVDASGKIRA